MTPLSKQILTNWLVKEIPDMVLDTDEQYGFGICGQVNGGPLKCLYEIFVNDLWIGEWPTPWKYIHIPVSKKHLIDKWYKDYNDSLFTIIVFSKDLERAWHIAAEIIMESKIIGDFYHVPTNQSYIVDMKNGNSNS